MRIPIVLVTGTGGVGKSTLINSLSEQSSGFAFLESCSVPEGIEFQYAIYVYDVNMIDLRSFNDFVDMNCPHKIIVINRQTESRNITLSHNLHTISFIPENDEFVISNIKTYLLNCFDSEACQVLLNF